MNETEEIISAAENRGGSSWTKKVLLAAAAVLLLGIVGIWIYRVQMEKKVQQKLLAIQKNGEPVDLQTLNQWHSFVPFEQNDAFVINQASSLISIAPSNSLDKIKWPGRIENLPAEALVELKRIVQTNAEPLRIIRESQKHGKARFPVDWTRGAGTLLPHLSKAKSLSLLLRLDAMRCMEEKDPDGAVRCVLEMFWVADALESELALISQFVRMAIVDNALLVIERLLNFYALPAPQIDQIENELADLEADGDQGYFRGLVCERTIGIDAFRMSPKRLLQLFDGMGSHQTGLLRNLEDPLKVGGLGILLGVQSATGAKDRDQLFYLDLMDRQIAAAKLPFPARKEALGEVQNKITSGNQLKFGSLMTRMLLPESRDTVSRFAGHYARVRMAQVALKIERFRLQRNNAIPERLETLIPEYLASVPVDPFDGAPLRYKTPGQGYAIYSVGEDNQDNGGEIRNSSAANQQSRRAFKSTKEHDIIFSVQR